MNILVPLNNRDYLKSYIDAGADEFYFGFHDDGWEENFGHAADINRMSGFGKLANKFSFKEAIELSKEIAQNGKKAYITLNANVYTKKQIEYISNYYLPHIYYAGISGVIVSEPFLAKSVVNAGVNAVASTMCGIYNVDIAQYYYNIGVKRMIIPRDLSLSEIDSITRKMPDVSFEVFLMRNGCAFSDGYCLGLHGECGSVCEFIRNKHRQICTIYKDFDDIHAFDLNDYIYSSIFHRNACGLCALYRFKKSNINSLKIVGRADMYKAVINDISIVKENLKVLDHCSSEDEYLKKMVFPKNSRTDCLMGMSCYYPEVRFE